MLLHPAGQCVGLVTVSKNICALGMQLWQPQLYRSCRPQTRWTWKTPSVCLQPVAGETRIFLIKLFQCPARLLLPFTVLVKRTGD